MSQLSGQLRKQTKEMAISAILLTRKLPQNDEGWTIKKQLIRSATSVAANYRSACRGRSDREFYSKLCIVVEELDESMFWLELTEDIELILQKDVQPVMEKMNKLLKILSAAKSTLRNKINPKELD
ncbi:MAG: four helix bundle protein [Bacteroidetes bacterium]|nr:four helix bundle protein [Bacteroidota bacterium]